MSQENVEVVRRIYEEGLIDRDPEQILELATPDIEYVNPPEAIDSGTRRGHMEVAQALRSPSELFDSYRHDLHELYDCGETVVAAVSFRTRSRGSESEVIQEEAHSWTLRDGRITRFEWNRDLAKALEAAGLSE